MRIHLWTLGADGGIDIAQAVALGGYQADGVAEDDFAVHAVGLGCRVGEVIANVAHVGGTEQRVADGVQQHVGVAVTQQTEGVVDSNAAHP